MDRPDCRLMKANTAERALKMSHSSSFILHMTSPERVRALAKGLLSLVALSGFKPRPCHSLPALCLKGAAMQGRQVRKPF